MGHGAGAARLHRQSRLGAVERLDLAFFIDREHHGMVGRIDVEADNILEFVSKFRIVRQLERADAMRRELMGLKDALHRTQAHAGCLGQHSSMPKEVVGGVAERTGGVPLFVEEVTHLLLARGERGGVDHQFAVMPPSITSSLPVTHEASSEAR